MHKSTPPYYDPVNDRLVITTDFSDIKTDYENLDLLIHDLNSAANTFSLLVEDMATDLKPQLTSRQYKKIQQLRNHANLNTMILKKICDSIGKLLEQRRSI